MADFLNGLLENSTLPFVTAFVLGLMTAISPCPLATNITAIGFIGKDLDSKLRVFLNGLVYTLGRAVAYTSLAIIIYAGADRFKVSKIFQTNGEKILGPLLVIIGFLMLNILKIRLPGISRLNRRFEKKGRWNYTDVLLLGIVFALVFCPYSGVLYFGMLIPLSIASVSGLYLPLVFAFATGLPVILFAWMIAFTVSGVGIIYNKLRTFELWFRRIIAVLFIAVGIYYILKIYIQL
ncbi:MAG TPA: aromatic aminobenezylarsenical efflux permease ArsG family transporter [Bacteroidales bacterium]|nr:aromatic aminobenezylarsenical efflux permease ArsG family transporter [Bacteroidales bacterium]